MCVCVVRGGDERWRVNRCCFIVRTLRFSDLTCNLCSEQMLQRSLLIIIIMKLSCCNLMFKRIYIWAIKTGNEISDNNQ